MKNIVILALIFASSVVFAGANDVIIPQRNSLNNGTINNTMPQPPSNALFMYDPVAKVPLLVTLGNGIQRSGSTLVASGASQVNSDWNAISGVAQILNKPVLAAVATSGQYADLSGKPTIPAAQVNADWNSTSGPSQILNKPVIPSPLSVGSPITRAMALGTAYQCTNTARPCIFSITLQSQALVSAGLNVTSEAAITIGPTSGVATGTGINIQWFKNNMGAGLGLSLQVNKLDASGYTVIIPAGWYIAVRQTSGSGVQVVSAFDQSL